jgi:class 3 adenylate cyclase
MALIERGDDTNEPARENFAGADTILARMGLGVLLLDGDLRVVGANTAARARMGMDPTGFAVAAIASGPAWVALEETIRDVLAGRRAPQCTQIAELSEGTILLANVVGLLVHRAARDGEAAGIDRVALVLTDWTDVVKRQRDIDAEQKRLTGMLQKVIPAKLCEDLEGGSNTLAAVSQSVTIGEIRVHPQRMDDVGILSFFAKVFGEFEMLMGGFDMLCTARTCFDRFVYAGGLLAKNRKTARHAEEAVRFALLVLAKAPEIAKRAGREFEIRIGVHTGGPIATGVMSLKRPAFQIIGPVLGLAAQLADEGLAGEVYLSRATYELIFASGFRIRERGEMTIRGGGTTMTYLVEPRVYR